MSELTEREKILNDLKPLFDEAREKGLWFNCGYQDLWFSPNELEEKHLKGEFIWGPVNWKLRDPKEHLENLREKHRRAAVEVLEFELKMKNH